MVSGEIRRAGNGFDILCTLQNVGRDEHRPDTAGCRWAGGLLWMRREREEHRVMFVAREIGLFFAHAAERGPG